MAAIFSIDVAAYAVMSNHYHVVVRIDRERASAWSVEEVLKRWTSLFTGHYLVSKYLSEARAEMSDAEIAEVLEMTETYRARLHDLSWFMRSLNETVARMANAEDGVKGRFWEGRFKSQALLDEKALLAAMAYVDLNPIRAGLAETPEASDFTSIQERIGHIPAENDADESKQAVESGTGPELATLDGEDLQKESEIRSLSRAELMPFDATGRTSWAIPFSFDDYLELVDWTGRAVHPDKRGRMDTDRNSKNTRSLRHRRTPLHFLCELPAEKIRFRRGCAGVHGGFVRKASIQIPPRCEYCEKGVLAEAGGL